MKVLVLDAATFLQERLLTGKNIRVKFLTCGRSNCACKLGKRHGPYYYARKKIGDKYVDQYLNPKSRPSWQFKYEILGSNLLLEVNDAREIPEQLFQYPMFSVRKKLNKE